MNIKTFIARGKGTATLVSLMITCSTVVAGGGGGGIVFDPTNFIQNTVTAGESLKSSSDRAIQLRTQLSQYQAQIKNLKSLSPDAFQMQLRQNAEDLRNVNGYINAVNKSYGSVQDVRTVMSRRFEEQRLSGMSWNDYVSSESQRLQDGVKGAADRAQQDRIVLEKVNADYQQAREWGDRVPQTDGMHSSMQLMNSQMNKVVTQNAEVIKGLTKASMQQSQDAIDRSTEKQAHQNMLKDLGRAAVEVGVRERAELSRLRAK